MGGNFVWRESDTCLCQRARVRPEREATAGGPAKSTSQEAANGESSTQRVAVKKSGQSRSNKDQSRAEGAEAQCERSGSRAQQSTSVLPGPGEVDHEGTKM